jgi:AcrR family transcriptional regulator
MVGVASRTAAKAKNGGNGASRAPRRRDGDVLEAAVKVFYERGYSDATVQDVADELGILKGSLYHYIDTKEDLLFQLVEEVHTEVEAILDGVKAEKDLEPLERLELYVRRQVEYNIQNLERISIYYHDLNRLTGDRLTFVKASRRVHDDYATKLISAAQKEGKADKAFDARMMANCVFGTIIWTYQWFRPGRMSRKTVVEVCVHHALRGVVG